MLNMFKRKSSFVAVFALAAFVAVMALGTGVFAYGVWHKEWDGNFVRSVARITSFPAAKIGERTITYVEFLTHLDATKRFITGPAGQAQGVPQELTPDIRQATLDRVLRIAAVEEFAQKQDIIVTPLDVDRVYDELIARAGTSTSRGEIQSFLMDQFGWEEKDFKNFVVRPAMMEDLLKAEKLKSDPNPDAFEKELLQRLAQSDVKKYLRF